MKLFEIIKLYSIMKSLILIINKNDLLLTLLYRLFSAKYNSCFMIIVGKLKWNNNNKFSVKLEKMLPKHSQMCPVEY